MCEMFEADQGNILQKAAIDAEAERGKNGSWIIGFVLCSCSTWPPSLHRPFIKKAYNYLSRGCNPGHSISPFQLIGTSRGTRVCR